MLLRIGIWKGKLEIGKCKSKSTNYNCQWPVTFHLSFYTSNSKPKSPNSITPLTLTLFIYLLFLNHFFGSFLCPPGPPRSSMARFIQSSESQTKAANKRYVDGLPQNWHGGLYLVFFLSSVSGLLIQSPHGENNWTTWAHLLKHQLDKNHGCLGTPDLPR